MSNDYQGENPSITAPDGSLRRRRGDTPIRRWSEAPGGPAAALAHGHALKLSQRDAAMLAAVEQHHILSSEQFARVFFNSPYSARSRLILLAGRRFVTRMEADPAMIHLAVGRRIGVKNSAYILDWNGYYLLTEEQAYEARNWSPSTAAMVTSRFGHTLGINEAWSYLVAAARATHDLDFTPASLISISERRLRYRLQVGFLNERESVVTKDRVRAASTASTAHFFSNSNPNSSSQSRSTRAGGRQVLVQPDATIIVGIQSLGANHKNGPKNGPKHDLEHEVGMAYGRPVEPPIELIAPSVEHSVHPRWDPTLHTWKQALMVDIPSARVIGASERAGGTGDTGGMVYRPILLEMETGSNNPQTLLDKIGSYNRLYGDAQAWRAIYGPNFPRVLVVVRLDEQVQPQTLLWRSHYALRAQTSVLVVSLQTLSRIYQSGRRSLIEEPCWVDVMGASRPEGKTLGEALAIASVMNSV